MEGIQKLHRSILVPEVLELMNVSNGARIADLTFGEGGHSEALLSAGATTVVGVDRDSGALDRFRARVGELPEGLEVVHSRYSSWVKDQPTASLDGVLMDLGVSTWQLMSAERGFSFRESGPLDMRMDPSQDFSLSELLSRHRWDTLADELYRNADLRDSRRIARVVLKAFDEGRLNTTEDLANLFPKRPFDKTHPATVIFMALRMMVNEELSEIDSTITELLRVVRPGGRIAVISFHSTEDRLVKQRFKLLAGHCICRLPICTCPKEKKVEILTKKPMVPSSGELSENPRSRSAKLRCVEILTI